MNSEAVAPPARFTLWRLALRFLLLVALPSAASAAPPSLSHLFPAGGQRGTKSVVTCSGKFDWPPQVFAPGIEVAPAAESGKLEVSIPADLPADRVWIRLHNSEGASAAVPFVIGQLPEINEQEPNNSPRKAQVVADPNVTINGALAAADVDGFAVRLAAGQTLVAALDAHTRLGSPMDAILQVVTPEGTVLAENHDDLGLDPRLAYTAPRAATCIVRVFAFPAAPDSSIAFHGGDNYVYRLTLTTGPYITHTLPLAAARSEPGAVEVAGWNVAPGTKLPVVPFGDGRLADFQEFEELDALRKSPDARLGFVFGSAFAGAARVRLNPFAAVATPASADAQNPAALPLGIAVTGWLKTPRQKDVYRLPLVKGQSVILSAESRNLDLPLDPVLQLADPTGAVVAEADDSGAERDAVLAHTAAHDGDYRVTVTDRYGQSGNRCLYLLTARLEEPDFELSAGADSLVIPADKPAELTIKIQRRKSPSAAVGSISIQSLELPPGVTAPAVVSEPNGATAGEVKLSFTSTGAAFSGSLRIVGKATQPKDLERTARTPAKLGVTHDTLWLTVLAK